jgi:hypothetical protein
MAPQDRLDLSRGDLEQLQEVVAAGRPPAELSRFLRQIGRDPVERRLGRLAEQARQLAQRLGKGDVDVRVEGNGVRLDGRAGPASGAPSYTCCATRWTMAWRRRPNAGTAARRPPGD